ncbi:PAS domain S-box-containing protein [Luteibacter sp. Sphag1AF]|uniref:sensor histidine kinase n=1 Tax=Luteibacter sp. Sphag1AF TaxID=2587031 RepID=UPI0016123A28|nr:HWE histidine kinase domain-containing protein [Luteibacter sp. Sphag1AF]MBB3226516.1 PAS domain S-box-containing protein [Luteibacter sp. Sphag1AF]
MNEDAGSHFPSAAGIRDTELRELADFAPVMIWRAGKDKRCDWFNQSWLRFTGRSMDEELGYGWAEGVHPDDLDRCVDTYNASFDARQPFSMEYRLRRADGEYVWLLDNGTPFSRNGEFAGYMGSCVDVSHHRESTRAQRILINELNHRVKNTLAIVQAMASQTFRSERQPDDSLSIFEARLRAMADAHDLLVARSWEDLPLQRIIEAAVAPHDPGGARVVTHGPNVMLRPETAVSVAMALHELFTNATKYGALSNAVGTVTVSWTIDDASPPILTVNWKERGGPPVIAPTQRGFGTRFIERVLANQVGGTAEVRFAPDGLECRFEAPIVPRHSGARRRRA